MVFLRFTFGIIIEYGHKVHENIPDVAKCDYVQNLVNFPSITYMILKNTVVRIHTELYHIPFMCVCAGAYTMDCQT